MGCAIATAQAIGGSCSQAKASESKKSTTAFGSQASCTMILDTSIWSSFDLEQKTLQPLDNPFGPRLSPMS